jgi:hypothetical protein
VRASSPICRSRPWNGATQDPLFDREERRLLRLPVGDDDDRPRAVRVRGVGVPGLTQARRGLGTRTVERPALASRGRVERGQEPVAVPVRDDHRVARGHERGVRRPDLVRAPELPPRLVERDELQTLAHQGGRRAAVGRPRHDDRTRRLPAHRPVGVEDGRRGHHVQVRRVAPAEGVARRVAVVRTVAERHDAVGRDVDVVQAGPVRCEPGAHAAALDVQHPGLRRDPQTLERGAGRLDPVHLLPLDALPRPRDERQLGLPARLTREGVLDADDGGTALRDVAQLARRRVLLDHGSVARRHVTHPLGTDDRPAEPGRREATLRGRVASPEHLAVLVDDGHRPRRGLDAPRHGVDGRLRPVGVRAVRSLEDGSDAHERRVRRPGRQRPHDRVPALGVRAHLDAPAFLPAVEGVRDGLLLLEGHDRARQEREAGHGADVGGPPLRRGVRQRLDPARRGTQAVEVGPAVPRVDGEHPAEHERDPGGDRSDHGGAPTGPRRPRAVRDVPAGRRVVAVGGVLGLAALGLRSGPARVEADRSRRARPGGSSGAAARRGSEAGRGAPGRRVVLDVRVRVRRLDQLEGQSVPGVTASERHAVQPRGPPGPRPPCAPRPSVTPDDRRVTRS